MVIALNMMDEVRANGGSIKVRAMQQALGVPVVPISASKNEGVAELIDTARARWLLTAKNQNEWTSAPGRCTSRDPLRWPIWWRIMRSG